MAKQKPKGWNAMSKAKQDAWKKANFDSSTKVTTAQLDKLRAAKTPDAAIAKYKNDPAMREALNRFYGKAKVNAAGGSGSSTSTRERPRGGPGAKMEPRPKGGPGARTGADGRVSSSTKKKSSLSNMDKLMVGAGVGAAGLAVLKGRKVAPLRRGVTQGLKQIEASPKVKAEMAAAKTKAKQAGATASKTIKAASKNKAVRVLGKAAKFAGVNTPAGRVVTGALIAAPYIKPLKPSKAKQGARKVPMGNPKKK